jgi:L-ascorbate metabolism protein UlaG (beta-lactamase superfamily)
VLLESAGTRLLTDPYFGTFGHIAYTRVAPPAIPRSEIGVLDGVLVSHGHWDHTDRRFFRELDAQVPVLVPSGTSLLFRLKGVRSAVSVKPWQSLRIGDLAVTAVPASHLARTVGFVIQNLDSCVYFAGDTFHRPFIAEIGRRFKIDVALMPVTTYRIPMTMGEKGAVKAVRDLRAPTVIPVHRGVRPRSPFLRSRQSSEGFAHRLREAGVRAEVVVLADGESWQPGDVNGEHRAFG